MPQRLSPVSMATLVPESFEWADGDVYYWITSVGHFSAMIGYGELFWPDLVEFEGCVFRSGIEEVNFRSWMERLGGDRSAVERVVNHVDLIYLFENNLTARATDPQITYLGRLLQEMWQAKLAREFPGRRFAVEFHEDPDDPNDQPLVTFFEILNA